MRKEKYAFHNKILRVDLGKNKISVDEPGQFYFRHYFGGWNIIADTLLHEVPAKTDPLSPNNKLIFAPGVLTGLSISGFSRSAVGSKSPLTGGFGASEAGGFWAPELKKAGFDAIIIEGRSEKPVYLLIKNGHAEICNASHLWGKTTKQTLEILYDELKDKRIRCATIGPGGENMVRYACIISDRHHAYGRTGMGAVMGSKNLKAVVVRGTIPLNVFESEKLRIINRKKVKLIKNNELPPIHKAIYEHGTPAVPLDVAVSVGNLPINNFRDGEFPAAAQISADKFMKTLGIGREGCFACPMNCKKIIKADSPYKLDPDYGGPEFESVAALGSLCGVDDIVTIAKAAELCNAYSLDTITTGTIIAFAMECFENGLLTTEDTDGIHLHFGNGDAVLKLIEKIAYRKGIGELLSKDMKSIYKEVGRGSKDYCMQVKGQGYPMHEPRFKRALALAYSVSPTGPDHLHALHDPGLAIADEDGFIKSEPMWTEALRNMGVLAPIKLESLGPEKVRATMYSMIVQVMKNCLLVCFTFPWNPSDIVDIVQAATGWDVSLYELLKVGERALTLARLFNMREGLSVDDDILAERSYKPTTSGALANGGIDYHELVKAIHNYYSMMGWDSTTGIPLPGKLDELDVSWAKSLLVTNPLLNPLICAGG